MNHARFGAVRRLLLTSAVLASFAVDATAQVVEKGRTFADLTASHPCASGLTERIARVTDCDAADDVGDGEGLFQCWVRCDGSAPWETVAIGGGAGGGGDILGAPLTATDDLLICTDGTGGSTIGACTVGSIDNLRLDGNTISTTNANGNLIVAPNGTGQVVIPHGSLTAPGLSVPSNNATGIHIVSGGTESLNYVINGVPVLFSSTARVRLPGAAWLGWISSTNTNANEVDAYFTRAAAGIVKITSTLNLALLASPPRTCDATAEGDIYSDTSHALCWCDASAWQKLSGAGTCA